MELYALVNDNPSSLFRDTALLICGDPDGPSCDGIYTDRETAIEKRDKVRAQANNPDVNVYRLEAERIDEGGQ